MHKYFHMKNHSPLKKLKKKNFNLSQFNELLNTIIPQQTYEKVIKISLKHAKII